MTDTYMLRIAERGADANLDSVHQNAIAADSPASAGP